MSLALSLNIGLRCWVSLSVSLSGLHCSRVVSDQIVEPIVCTHVLFIDLVSISWPHVYYSFRNLSLAFLSQIYLLHVHSIGTTGCTTRMESPVLLLLLPNSCFYTLVEVLANLYTSAYHYFLLAGKVSVISGDLIYERVLGCI